MAANMFSDPHSAIRIPHSTFRNPISSPLVDRLKQGTVPALPLRWGQPYKEILFGHLYSRKAFQRAYDPV
jgi:hypothetical protein